MVSDDVKGLRQTLGYSVRQLADALAVDSRTILAWEAGELFPTKRHVAKMQTLLKQGPAVEARSDRRTSEATALSSTSAQTRQADDFAQALLDPRLWQVVKRLVDDPELLSQTVEFVEKQALRTKTSS